MINKTIPRVQSLLKLNDEQLEQKRQDIMICLRDAKTEASKDAFEYQLATVEEIQSTRYDLAVTLKRKLADDTHNNEWDPNQDTWDFIFFT